MTHPPRPHEIHTRLVDGRIRAYDLAGGESGVLSPAATFPPASGDDVVDQAVTSDLRRAVYTTVDHAVCVTPGGSEIWRAAFEPPSTRPYGHRPGCVLSLDDRVAWIYRPDALAGRNRTDRWVALDAGTGQVIAEAALETSGHGAGQFRHPDGRQVFLDVGEGQDGTALFRGALDRDRLDVVAYPWSDRCLIALAPGGTGFMTVAHDQTDAAFHDHPDGGVTLRFPVEAFGHDPDDAWVEWNGGYLTPDTAVVTIVGETGDGREWFRHYRVGLASGETGAEFDGHAAGAYDLRPLGDGTWLTTDTTGHPIRWSDRQDTTSAGQTFPGPARPHQGDVGAPGR